MYNLQHFTLPMISLTNYKYKLKPILLASIFFFYTISHLLAQDKKWVFRTDKMGSPFTITIINDDSAHVAEMNQKCITIVDSLIHIISDYDSTSELSKLNKNAGISSIKISRFLEHILWVGKDASIQTKGAYTIAIGPLSVLWRKARKTNVFPSKEAILSAKKYIDCKDLVLDTLKHTAYLAHSSMRIDLGSLGKGYVAQFIVDYLRQNGFNNCMVDAGGKIVTSKPNNDPKYWVIGINLPRSEKNIFEQRLKFKNCAVATSGDRFQFIEKDGVRYSHIIDPHTGYGITTPKNVTAIASDGLVADWLSTACSLLSIKEAKKLASQNHGEILISSIEGKKINTYQTKGFDTYFKIQNNN